jgi:hypothetical protein
MGGETSQREIVWEQTETRPFNELILSWNANRPEDGRLAFLIRVQKEGNWSPWLYYAEWGVFGQMLFKESPEDSFAESNREKIKVKEGLCDGFAIKVIASGGASMSALKTLIASPIDLSELKPARLPEKELESVLLSPVPRQSQITLRHPRYQDLSLPTATSVAINYLLGRKAVDPSDFARQVLDEDFDFYESWVLNCAESAYRLGDGYRVHVERCADFETIHSSLKEGCPVLVGMRGFITGGPRPFYTEHALCLIGYDPGKQKVYCIDTAFPNEASTFVAYPLDQFLTAWAKQGNIACFFKTYKNR